VKGPGQFITAGNASQLSDGASACVLMEAAEAERLGLQPLGAFRGMAVAGCEPDEMGIGPVFAVPKLLARHGLKVDDIDLWELNEAFASQASTASNAGHPRRTAERQRRCHLDRPPLRHDRRAPGGPCAAGRPAPQGQVRGRDHVHCRRHGCRWPVRNFLTDTKEPDMDLNFSPEEEAFRAEVRAFLADNCPPACRQGVSRQAPDQSDQEEWHAILNKRGWLANHWPERIRRPGWNAVEKFIFDNECALAGGPRIVPFGVNMLGPVLIKYGNEAQKRTGCRAS
jgi:hypothetical protein